MKKVRSFLALVLALVMVLSLAACGKKEEDKGNKPNNTEHPDFVYKAEFKTLSFDANRGISVYGACDDGVYVTWSEKVGSNIPEGVIPDYEGQYDMYASCIGIMDKEGNIKKLDNYQPVEPDENTDGVRDFYSNSYISTLIPGKDGNLISIEEKYSSWNEAPESVGRDSNDYWNYYRYKDETYFRVLSADGTEISSNAIDIAEGEYLNTYRAVLDGDGNLVTSSDNSIVAIAPDGSRAYTINADIGDSWINDVYSLKDGRILATMYGNNGLEMRVVDTAAKKFGDTIEMPMRAYDFFTGAGDYDLYYNNGVNLFGFNIETGESTKILNWLDCDVNANNMNRLSIDRDGNIIVLINNWSYNRYSDEQGEDYYELAVISKVPYESVPEKTVLTVATQYVGYYLNNVIIKFNRANDSYRISVKDYSEYNTEDDYSAGMTKLTTEILAGNLPDMLLINGDIPYSQYASKGILEDLYPFIDADSELKRDDIFPTVRGALEVDGKLCQAAAFFSLYTVMGPASVVGDTPGWNYDQLNEALASMPEGCTPFDVTTTRDSILQTCLALDMDEYVNWSTGECRFDNPEFVKLLEFAKTFPAEFDYDNYDWENDNPNKRISEGMQLLMSASVYSFDDIIYNEGSFGSQPATYIGFPTISGVGNMMNINTGIAMTKNCSDKDGAWQFIRTFLTEEGQKSMDAYSLPTNVNLFNKYLKYEMTPQYEKDAEGNYRLDENGERIPLSRGGYGMPDGTVIEIYAITQEQADKLMELINTTTKLANYNDSMFSIVQEQAQAFFAGQKSAEEVAKLIQSKANIYVNEQR